MQNLPSVKANKIPLQRRASSVSELHQFILDDQEFWHEQAKAWVQETARRGHDEIVKAGNPKFHISEVNGTTGKSGGQRRGFTPGGIEQARTSVRVLYQADELAKVANGLRPILTSAIHMRFPNSKMKRLERDWVWYVVRDRQLKGGGGIAEYLGGSVNTGIGVYDVLYLVPEKKHPADYAWFANWLGKHGVRKAVANRRSRKHWSERKEKRDRRNTGFMETAAKGMRGRRQPGVSITAVFLETAMGASYSRVQKHRGKMPAIRVAFYPLRNAVTN